MSRVKDFKIDSAKIFYECEANINGSINKEKRFNRHHSSNVNIINVPFNAYNKYHGLLSKRIHSL